MAETKDGEDRGGDKASLEEEEHDSITEDHHHRSLLYRHIMHHIGFPQLLVIALNQRTSRSNHSTADVR